VRLATRAVHDCFYVLHDDKPIRSMRAKLRSATSALIVAAVCIACAAAGRMTAVADPAALPLETASPVPHAAGDILDYSVRGTMSQSIVGRNPYGGSIRQLGAPTDVLGHERIAFKVVSARGLSLHRTGSIMATFRGRSSPAQAGSGWTLVKPDGSVADRKGSTLGGLFLLPLGFLENRALDGGNPLRAGDRWNAKLGMALYGMAAQPLLHFDVTGSQSVGGISVVVLTATGTAPVKEPIVTNDDVALGTAVGIAHVSLRCDYDPVAQRVVDMQIEVSDELRIAAHGRGATVQDRQHYVVALDGSVEHDPPPVTAATPQAPVTAPPR
jgi:hypothetical protein